MWEAVLVLFVAGLAVSRLAGIVNELIGSALPRAIGNTGLTSERIVTWIVAAAFSVITVLVVEYDPLAAIGFAAGADDVWNILMMFAVVDAADALYRGRIIRR